MEIPRKNGDDAPPSRAAPNSQSTARWADKPIFKLLRLPFMFGAVISVGLWILFFKAIGLIWP